MSVTEENPFAAPATGEKAFLRGEEQSGADYEADRRKHLNRETNIKTVGSLAILSGIFALLATVGMFIGLAQDASADSAGDGAGPIVLILLLVMGGCFLALTAASFWGGVSLRRLQPMGRGICTVLLVLHLLTLNPLPILFLYLLWARPADRIFRRDYREVVIPATPHIQYRYGWLMKVLVGILLLLILGAIAGRVWG